MLKIQCRCGHKIAVPTEYGGRRVKCPKCQGPIQVPQTESAAGHRAPAGRAPAGFGPRVVPAAAPAAPPSQDASHDVIRKARSIRHAKERQQKSHNTTVAMIAGLMVILGLALMLIIGANNRPETPVDPPETARKKSRGSDSDNPVASTLKPIGARDSSSNSERGGGDESVTVAGERFSAGSGEDTPVATTSTFDAASNLTTIKSQPSSISIAGRVMTLTVVAMHDGKDLRSATQLTAQIRIKGDFTDLISSALNDDPLMTLEIDGREHDFRPTKREGGEARTGENAPEKLPNLIEYHFDKVALTAIARGSSIDGKLGAQAFNFTPEQVALFKSLVPAAAPAKPATPAKTDDKEMDEKDAPKPDDADAKPDAAAEKPATDEVMEK